MVDHFGTGIANCRAYFRPIMKSTLLLLTASLLLNLNTSAQDDARSRAIVDKLVAKSKTWTSFEADFTTRLQSTKDKLDVKQTGTIKTKGKKFNLVLADNTIINDGTALYTYSKETNEVTISDPAEMDQELDPSKLFTTVSYTHLTLQTSDLV